MLAGELDRLIDIERKVIQHDDFGEEVEAWHKIATRRAAKVTPLRGDERFAARQFVAKQHVDFLVRWSPALADLNPLDRIVYPPFISQDSPPSDPPGYQWYDILEVSEIGRREGLKILATRRSEGIVQMEPDESPSGDSP